MPSRKALVVLALCVAGCRIETVDAARTAATSCSDTPAGELVVYTSMYPAVVDALTKLAHERLPGVTLKVFQSGSEKVAHRLDAEIEAGGAKADVLAVSDPFLYERLRRDGHLLRYASPNVLRVPPSLVDPDGHYAAIRVSTMVVSFKRGLAPAPPSFASLTESGWKNAVALGDPLTSGTAFSWAFFEARTQGDDYFTKLRANEAVVAGGNAAVQQKIESGEAKAGVLLLENVLVARDKGSALDFAWPADGAVTIPGFAAILANSRNPVAAKAFVDLLLSQDGQRLMLDGRMHAVDPRLPGPSGLGGIEDLLARSRPWTETTRAEGVAGGGVVKRAFSAAFAQ